jgi:hypothetical protein
MNGIPIASSLLDKNDCFFVHPRIMQHKYTDDNAILVSFEGNITTIPRTLFVSDQIISMRGRTFRNLYHKQYDRCVNIAIVNIPDKFICHIILVANNTPVIKICDYQNSTIAQSTLPSMVEFTTKVLALVKKDYTVYNTDCKPICGTRDGKHLWCTNGEWHNIISLISDPVCYRLSPELCKNWKPYMGTTIPDTEDTKRMKERLKDWPSDLKCM